MLYFDTDSVITTLDLSDEMNKDLAEEYRADGKGDMLGMLKNERGMSKDGKRDLPYDYFVSAGAKSYAISDRTVISQTASVINSDEKI